MNRRRFLHAAPATVAVLALHGRMGVLAQATPLAQSALPVDFAEVDASYTSLAEQTLATGRAYCDLLLSGETTELFAHFSAEMQQFVPEADLATLIPSFETNRAHFEVPEFGLVFETQVDGPFMNGILQSDNPLPFLLTRIEAGDCASCGSPTAGSPVPEANPLAGTWEGSVLIPDDGSSVGLVITIAQDGATGTLSVPEQQLFDAPLSNIWFEESMPIETRMDERGLPHSPDMQYYWARYGWGERTMIVTIAFDSEGTIQGALLAPEWLLPPDPAAELPALAPVRLPFDQLWWVIWGGETTPDNYHATDHAQRHALDLAIWNQGGTYHGDGTENEDYWIWGVPVLAPSAGTVATVLDGIEANTPGMALPDVHIAGNHVVLQTEAGAYIYLAHLQKDSIAVAEGATVAAGDLIGLAGNSGNSSEPHLHIHAQTEVDLLSPSAIGLPLIFANVLVDGALVERAAPVQGSFIAHAG